MLLQEIQGNSHRYGTTLLLFSFVYGILHAVGKSHGKVVITTYLSTYRFRLRQSLLMMLATALLLGETVGEIAATLFPRGLLYHNLIGMGMTLPVGGQNESEEALNGKSDRGNGGFG